MHFADGEILLGMLVKVITFITFVNRLAIHVGTSETIASFCNAATCSYVVSPLFNSSIKPRKNRIDSASSTRDTFADSNVIKCRQDLENF